MKNNVAKITVNSGTMFCCYKFNVHNWIVPFFIDFAYYRKVLLDTSVFCLPVEKCTAGSSVARTSRNHH